jgi:hypothetical protein
MLVPQVAPSGLSAKRRMVRHSQFSILNSQFSAGRPFRAQREAPNGTPFSIFNFQLYRGASRH